jgi:hypothetical protein
VTAWCLLAFVVGVARAQIGDAIAVTASTAAYIAVMFVVVGPVTVVVVIVGTEGGPADRKLRPVIVVVVLLPA